MTTSACRRLSRLATAATLLLVTLPLRAAGPAGGALGAGADLPFSPAVRLGDTLYLSGQIGVLPGTRTLVPGGLRAQAQQALENIRATLAANGRSTQDLVKCTVMLADIGEWEAFNEVWRAFLTKPYPARSALGAAGLALGARVEIDCIARAAP
jgi:reactive intermediate/imine deaminase